MPYATLDYFFPKVHRITRYRWRKAGKVRPPDLIVNNREYWDTDRSPCPDNASPDQREAASADET